LIVAFANSTMFSMNGSPVHHFEMSSSSGAAMHHFLPIAPSAQPMAMFLQRTTRTAHRMPLK